MTSTQRTGARGKTKQQQAAGKEQNTDAPTSTSEQRVWQGLYLHLKQRTPGNCAGYCPPLPYRFALDQPLSISSFAEESQAAISSFEDALHKAQLTITKSPVLQDDELSVADLVQPGPIEILVATTYEIEKEAPTTANDTRWQPWNKEQSDKRPVRSVRSRGRGKTDNKSNDGQVPTADVAAPEECAVTTASAAPAADTIVPEPAEPTLQQQQTNDRNGRPHKRARFNTSETISQDAGAQSIAAVQIQSNQQQADRNATPKVLHRKAPEEITASEWQQLYKQHEWVYKSLGVLPPMLPQAPSTSQAATTTGFAVPGSDNSSNGDSSVPTQIVEQGNSTHTRHEQEAVQGNNTVQQPASHEPSQQDQQAIVPATSNVQPDNPQAVVAVAGKLTTRLDMVAQWRSRLDAAMPHLFTLQDLAAARARSAGEDGEEAKPDLWLLQTAAAQWNKHYRMRAVQLQAEQQAAGQQQPGAGQSQPQPQQPMPAVLCANPTAGSQVDAHQVMPQPSTQQAAETQTNSQPQQEASTSIGHASQGRTHPVQHADGPPQAGNVGHDDVDWRNEVLVTVCIFAPRRNDLMSDEFVMLGSQPLTALVDHMHCVAALNLTAAQQQGSGGSYVFMEGCFYNDTRNPKAVDLSAPIIKLCEQRGQIPTHMDVRTGKGTGLKLSFTKAKQVNAAGEMVTRRCQTAAMTDTTFSQLSARLANHPNYLFCHLGCCEHVIMVRDVRCMHPADPRQRSAYPLQLLPARLLGFARQPRRCEVCEGNMAEKVAYNDPMGPGNPCFYCARCVELLHPRGPPHGTSIFPYVTNAS